MIVSSLAEIVGSKFGVKRAKITPANIRSTSVINSDSSGVDVEVLCVCDLV